MALDEAILDLAAESASTSYFRTYAWSRPTLSLGYFQRVEEVHSDPRWQSVDLVRRATGGGAIWHHHELTYMIVLAADHPCARPASRLYRTAHGAIAELLRELGLPAGRRGAVEAVVDPSRTASSRPFLCFADHDPEDIVSGCFKIVGSAQRRRTGAILQHGSIVLRRSERTPELPGACDLAELPEDLVFWSERVGRRVLHALDLCPVAAEVPWSARSRAEELERSVYAMRGWTGRR
jgi:lipoate-protein ligase A